MANWDRVSGQDHIIQYFSKVAKTKKITHAYILEGEPGTPKEPLGIAFARLLLCENGTGCGKCLSCRAIDGGNHPDVIRVRHEKPDVIRIDEIREQLIDDITIRPYRGEYKIYLVEDAEKMNIAAQNALLKTLEEPPSYGIILLLAASGEAFLPTILSRSIRLRLNSGGNSLDRIPEEDRLAVLSCLRRVGREDRTFMAKAVADWKERGMAFSDIANLIRVWMRDILVWKTTGERERLVLRSEVRAIETAADHTSFRQIQRILQAVDAAERRIASNVNMELAAELMLAEMKQLPAKAEEAEDGWGELPLPDMEEVLFYERLQEENS